MADPTRYGSANVSPAVNLYAEAKMLAHAAPVIVLDKFGMAKPMPKNKTETISWRRPDVFSAADTPLSEGVTPSSTAFTFTDITATMRQYGMIVEVTDKIEDLHTDPVISIIAEQVGENIGRTIEKITFGVLRAGTNVFYATGAARSSVNTAVTLNKIRAVVRNLKSNKAMPITRVLDGSPNFQTKPVEAAYVCVVHTHLEADLRGLAGFTPVSEYGQRRTVHDYEFGSIEDVRFVCSPDLAPFTDAGGTAGSMVTTSGTSADVYPMLFFGKEAYGTVPLRGMGAVEPTILRPGTVDKADPLGQRGYVGFKTWYTAAILNQSWMARLEVAATDL